MEAQVTVVTRCPELRESLHQEQEGLFKQSDKVTAETFKEADRHVPYWCRAVVALFRNFF